MEKEINNEKLKETVKIALTAYETKNIDKIKFYKIIDQVIELAYFEGKLNGRKDSIKIIDQIEKEALKNEI